MGSASVPINRHDFEAAACLQPGAKRHIVEIDTKKLDPDRNVLFLKAAFSLNDVDDFDIVEKTIWFTRDDEVVFPFTQ